MSQKKAGLEFGVPRSILQNRINGTLSRQEAHKPQQRLSTVQEDRLTQWILTQESLGHGPTHAQIRAFAGRVLYARGDANPLGRRWMNGFLRRTLVLKTKKQFLIDSAYINNVITKVIKK
jgi:hypothetical protein